MKNRTWETNNPDRVRAIKRKYANSEHGKKKKLEYQRVWRKTKNGVISTMYQNMRKRVSGKDLTKIHLYKGMVIIPRGDFKVWVLSQDSFHSLFDLWVESGHKLAYIPSIDRIDSSIGYIVDNMRILTHSENSRLGAISRHSK